MSRIYDMVKELCPDGFERVPLGSIATQHVDPVRVQPDATYVNLGVKWYGEGAFARDPKAGKDIKAATLYRVKPGQFIYNRMFVTEGAFGLVTADLSNGVVSNEFPVYDLDPTRVLPDWLLLKFQDPSTVRAAAAETTGGTKSRRRWKEDQFEAFVIDLPPIPVQREITRILSTFSKLQVELKAELELRLLQYAHYRDSLLVPDSDDVPRSQLGQLATVVRGASPRPIQQFLTDSGNGVPWIKIGDVAKGDKYITSTEEHVTPEGAAKSRRVWPGDFVLSNSMSFGRPYISKIEGCIHDGWLAISNFGDSFIPDFLYHLLRSAPVQDQFARRAGASTVQNLNADIVRSVTLPVPALMEQERIVDILDKFDVLVNDPSRGLPAELKARRKQYEYYRDRLLTFKELTA